MFGIARENSIYKLRIALGRCLNKLDLISQKVGLPVTETRAREVLEKLHEGENKCETIKQ